MDHIDELLENMGKENPDVHQSPLNDIERKRILNRTMEKITLEEKMNRATKHRLGKPAIQIAVACFVVVILLIGSGTAIAHFHIDAALRNYFQADVEDSKKADQMISFTDAKDSCNGVALSVNQVIGDNTGLTAVLKAKNPPDYIGNLEFEETDIAIDGAEEITWDTTEMGTDEDARVFLLQVSSPDILGKDINLSLTNLGYRDDKGKFVLLTKGTWKLNWTLNYKNESETTKMNSEFEWKDGNHAIWDSVTISPLSVTVHFNIVNGYKTKLSSKRAEELQEEDRLVVLFKDGTRLDSRFMDDTSQYNEYYDHITMGFHKIIDIRSIAEVTFAGNTHIFEPIKEEQRIRLTADKCNFTLDVSQNLNRIMTMKQDAHYYDPDLKAHGSSATFIGNIKDCKMTMFSIYKLKGLFSDKDLEEKSPFMNYIGYHGGYTYTLRYGEIQNAKQNKYFPDVMNEEVAKLLPYFEYIK